MVRITPVLFAAILLFVRVAPAHAEPLDLGLAKPVQYTLGNGLSVVLHHDRRRPRVAVAVAYRAGLRETRRGTTGWPT